MNVLGQTPQHVDDAVVVKGKSLYDAVRHERVIRLAENGVTGRAARRKLAQIENREARKAARMRPSPNQATAGVSDPTDLNA